MNSKWKRISSIVIEHLTFCKEHRIISGRANVVKSKKKYLKLKNGGNKIKILNRWQRRASIWAHQEQPNEKSLKLLSHALQRHNLWSLICSSVDFVLFSLHVQNQLVTPLLHRYGHCLDGVLWFIVSLCLWMSTWIFQPSSVVWPTSA